jgi:hypothetical protein
MFAATFAGKWSNLIGGSRQFAERDQLCLVLTEIQANG